MLECFNWLFRFTNVTVTLMRQLDKRGVDSAANQFVGVFIGGEAGGGAQVPPMTELGAPCTLHPPTLTPVDRNKTYCFHELVLNLPAPLDIQ